MDLNLRAVLITLRVDRRLVERRLGEERLERLGAAWATGAGAAIFLGEAIILAGADILRAI